MIDPYKIYAYWEDVEMWFVIDTEYSIENARKAFATAIDALPHLNLKLFEPTNNGANEREIDEYQASD